MADERAKWLADLKVTDKVAVIRSHHTPGISSVERVTAAQIILLDDRRYSRKTGDAVPREPWSTDEIQPVTDEVRQQVKRYRLIQMLNHVKWGDLTDSQLSRIAAIAGETTE